MRWFVILTALSILAPGCGDNNSISVSGWSMRDFFPFDGTRTWEFEQPDGPGVSKLVASYGGEWVDLDDGTRTYEVRYDNVCVDNQNPDCADSWARSLVWSAAIQEGIRVHAVHAPEGDVTLDPPVTVASGEMFVGDVAVTTGTNWQSEFLGIEPCPVLWTSEWDRCAHLRLSGGEGIAGDHLNGDYWAVSSFNVVAINLDADPGQWQLSYATFEP